MSFCRSAASPSECVHAVLSRHSHACAQSRRICERRRPRRRKGCDSGEKRFRYAQTGIWRGAGRTVSAPSMIFAVPACSLVMPISISDGPNGRRSRPYTRIGIPSSMHLSCRLTDSSTLQRVAPVGLHSVGPLPILDGRERATLATIDAPMIPLRQSISHCFPCPHAGVFPPIGSAQLVRFNFFDLARKADSCARYHSLHFRVRM